MRTHLSGAVSFALYLGCCLTFPLPHCVGADGTPASPARPTAPAAPTSRPSTGLPAVPDAATQQKAMRVVEDVYRQNLSDAKTPSRQAALAETLLKTAGATRNDPAGQYALLT